MVPSGNYHPAADVSDLYFNGEAFRGVKYLVMFKNVFRVSSQPLLSNELVL